MNDDVLDFVLDSINENLENTATIDGEEIAEEFAEHDIELKVCDTCGKLISRGYCLFDGEEYYCSDECMLEQYTPEEKEEILKDAETDHGTSYWTSWN